MNYRSFCCRGTLVKKVDSGLAREIDYVIVKSCKLSSGEFDQQSFESGETNGMSRDKNQTK